MIKEINKEIQELTYQEIQDFLKDHRIKTRPFLKQDFESTYQRLNINNLPSKLEDYYKNIGRTMCSIKLNEIENDPCTRHELLMLDDLKVQEINDQRYLIFAKSMDNTEALFMNVMDIDEENPMIYTTNQKMSTLNNYLYHLLYALTRDESVLKAMRFYTLIEEKKEEKREEAHLCRMALFDKGLSNITSVDFRMFLEISGIQHEPYDKESLSEFKETLSLGVLPKLLETYYLEVGKSSIEKAVPTKILDLGDVTLLEYDNEIFIKCIYDANKQNALLIKKSDAHLDNPKLYRYMELKSTLVESGQTLKDYLTYLFTVILTSDEWINYLSNL